MRFIDLSSGLRPTFDEDAEKADVLLSTPEKVCKRLVLSMQQHGPN